MNKTWRTVRVLVELPIRGGTDKAIVDEVRHALDDRRKTTTTNFLERGRYQVKDYKRWINGKKHTK